MNLCFRMSNFIAIAIVLLQGSASAEGGGAMLSTSVKTMSLTPTHLEGEVQGPPEEFTFRTALTDPTYHRAGTKTLTDQGVREAHSVPLNLAEDHLGLLVTTETTSHLL